VAFGPFSEIEIKEPSKEFAELAAIIEGLGPFDP
jgi:hypothetical protein